MFLLCSQKLYTYTASRQKCQNDPKSVPPGCKRSMMFPPTFGHLFFQNMAPPFCTNLQYFAIVFLKLSRKNNYFSAACLLAYANLLQREKEKGGEIPTDS